MDSSIIFEKKYSQFIEECCSNSTPKGYEISGEDTARNDLTDYVRKLLADSVSIIIPERLEQKNYFINLSKEIAEAYLIDIVILEHNNRITVMYTLDYDASFHCLKPIIQLADEFSFRGENDAVLMSLDYYTHATYQSGHRVLPLCD